jgi:hypothetical protein
MRENWLSNRIFRTHDDILDHCCYAWNELLDQPWTIMSIGLPRLGPWVLIRKTWYQWALLTVVNAAPEARRY